MAEKVPLVIENFGKTAYGVILMGHPVYKQIYLFYSVENFFVSAIGNF